MDVTTHPPEILGLIADPHRWRLLHELSRSDRRVGELTALIGKPQNLVSYHLRELRKAGVVSSRRSSADGRDVYYRVDLHRCRDLVAAAGERLHPALRLAPAPRPDRARGPRPRVLFLCTGNSARSQMAEALLVARSGGTIDARSAGSHPKPLHPEAVRAMAERGIDIAGHASTHLQHVEHLQFDRAITLCDRVREVCPDLDGAAATSHWSIPDPAADGDPAAFDRVAEELEGRIDLLIAELTDHIPEGTTHG